MRYIVKSKHQDIRKVATYMERETWLDKAVSNYHAAELFMNYWKNDSHYFNFIGHYLQQTVEFCMKYQLEQADIKYPDERYEIDQLIRIGKENRADMLLTDYIDDHSEMFTLWEFQSNENIPYQIEQKKLFRAMDEVRIFLGQMLDQEQQLDDERKFLKDGSLLKQKELNSRLLSKYFPNSDQLTLLDDGTSHNADKFLKQAYIMRNKA